MIDSLHHPSDDEAEGFLDAWGGECVSPAWLPADAAGPAVAVRYALLHPAYGVALIDLAPENRPEAAARFGAAYAAQGAGAVPPVVYLSLSEADRWRLTVLLDAAFSVRPAPGGGGWLERARALLSAVPEAALPATEAVPEAVPEEVAGGRLAEPAMADLAGIRLTETMAAQPAEIRLAEALAAEPAEIRLSDAPVAETFARRPVEAPAERLVVRPPAVPAEAAGPARHAEPVLEERPSLAVPPGAMVAPGGRPGMARRALPLVVLLLAGVGGAAWTGHLPLPGGMAAPRGADGVPAKAGDVAASPGRSVTAAVAPEPAPPMVAAEAPVEAAAPVLAPTPAPVETAAEPPAPVAGTGRIDLAGSSPSSAPAEGPAPGSAPPAGPVGPLREEPLPEEPAVAGPVTELAGPALPLPEPSLPRPSLPVPPLPGSSLPGASLPEALLPGPATLPAVAAAPRPPPGPVAPELLAALVKRGDAMMAIGDVSAARLFYERAAAAGSGAAATAMGRSYDPEELATLGVRGLRGDPVLAAAWYRRGVALGDAEARGLVRRLASVEGRAP